MTHDSSTWIFGPDGLIDEQPDARREAVAKEQHALQAMETADPTFAKAITAKLVPDRTDTPDVLRRTP